MRSNSILKTGSWLVLGVTCALTVACEKSPEQANKEAAEAVHTADQKTAEAQRNAALTAADAQAEANEKIARANTNAAEDINKAQAHAGEQQAEATKALLDKRIDVKKEAQDRLDELTKKANDLRVKAAKNTHVAKVDADAALKRIDDKAADVRFDLAEVDKTTAATVSSVKAKLDQDLDAMKKAIDDGSHKVD